MLPESSDTGRFTIDDEDFYWKTDHYDRNLDFHFPDPADPSAVQTSTNSSGNLFAAGCTSYP